MLQKKIIIGIINCKKNEHKQNDIRNTWIKDLNYYKIKYYFIIGHNKKTEIIDDVIYLNCNDGYDSLTNKIGLFTKYVYDNTEYEYIYKLDDDCYLNVEYFMKINLKDITFLGKFISRNNYSPNWGFEHNKNKIIEKTINFDFFGGGYGYIINKECIKIICDNLNLLNSYFLEDVSIAKILYDFGNIRAKKLNYDTCNLTFHKHYFKCITITNVNNFIHLYNKINHINMNFGEFIDYNKIKQIYRSTGVSDKIDIKHNYENINDTTLFYGMYNLKDYKVFFNHVGKKYIYWCGNDSLIKNKFKLNLLIKLSKTQYEGNICSLVNVEEELKKVKINVINLNKEKVKTSNLMDIKNKLYIKMCGGLGNQLFQFFNLISLSKEYNMDFDLCFDKNYKKHHPSEKYLLFKNIKFNELTNEDLINYEIYQEPEFKYNKILLDCNKNYFIKGYYQSYKYFWDYKDEIKKYIYIDYDKINKIKNLFNSYNKKILSIHMRLKDYIEYNEIHYNTTNEYYKNKLKYYNLNEYQLILFSDDIILANNMLKDLNLNYIFANDLFENDEDQFYMLALSNVRICPASSFSLMSCYLNEIFNFIDDCDYIFPDKWFGPKGPEYNYKDLIDFSNLNFNKITNIEKYLLSNNLNISEVNNNLLFILNNDYCDNINFFIKCITLVDFSKYNIYLYSENLNDKRIDLIKNNFKNVNLLTDLQINCSIVIFENITYINSFKFNKFIKYFIYCKSKSDIKLIDNSITYINCLNLTLHLQNIPILNIDNQSSHILKKNDNNKLELVKIKKSNNFEHYFYVNSYILTNIDILKSDKEFNNDILLEEINDKNYYSSDGIIKYNNLFYYKIKNKIEEININNLIYKLNNKIDHIYYNKVENIYNLIPEDNLQLHFTILILSYNNTKFVDINLKSALTQKYNNFDVIYINCQSTDNTADLAYNIGKNYNNFYLFNNTKRCYQTENFILGSLTAKKNSIIVSLDGDDWLYDDNVLSKLNMIYLAKRCLMTYGLYVEYPYREVNFARSDKINIIKENKFRKNKQSVSHLRTWKRELILNIRYDDLLYNNEFPKMAGDISVLNYMIEMSFDRACFVRDRLYVYNLINENSDHNTNINLQVDTADYFFNKKPYNKINNFNKIIELDILNKSKIEPAFKGNIILNKLLELYYEDKISSYKHLFYNFYFFKYYNNFDKLNLSYKISPVLSNNIELNPNLDLNLINKYQIFNDIKLSNYAFNENLDLSLNQNKIYFYLKNCFLNNTINFKNINFYKKFFTTDADINIIIPVQNRKENFEYLIKNLLTINRYKYTIMITVVEMNDNKSKEFSEENKINYLSFHNDLYKFNKSLCANFLYYIYEINNINYKYLIFQDVDCIVNKDIIKNIFEFNDYENKFIQPYKENRVLYTNEELANNIRMNNIEINKIDVNTKGIIVPGRGSPGGSIFMKKKIFENVGGLDYYFFNGYGPEDIFFYIKLLTLYECDNNKFSEIIHLWHEPQTSSLNANHSKFVNLYLYLNIDYKSKLLNLFKKHLCNI